MRALTSLFTTPARAFATFRCVFGGYLLGTFAHLVPYGPELFSTAGVLPQASLNPTDGTFPNVLALFDKPRHVDLFLGALIVLTICFGLGVARRSASLALWYGWVCLAHRNNLIHNPSVPYVAWLLLACSIVPPGEGKGIPGTSWYARSSLVRWRMPRLIRGGAWLMLGLGYTLSGLDKYAHSPSWRNGDAVRFVLETPLARAGWADCMLELPSGLLAWVTWTALAAELSFGPLALWPRTRPIAWLVMTTFHVGILLVLEITGLTVGMLVVHLFVFEPGWLKVRGLNDLRGQPDLQESPGALPT